MKALFVLIFLLVSCSKFIKSTDSDYFEVSAPNGADKLAIFFSGNINGETHPCGCRSHPLGGLPQIAGHMYEVKKKYPSIYVDMGDTFFPGPSYPVTVKNSIEFTALQLVDALNKLGLDYYVPGDQDFAAGEEFLAQISKKAEFTFLVSNFSKQTKIKHKKWVKRKFLKQTIFFIGVLDPNVFSSKYSKLLTPPEKSIAQALKEINQEFPDKSKRKVILLSHSGLDTDKSYAKKFPELNWILGSHSQSFLRFPVDENKSKLGQVLSRNHYLGQLMINAAPEIEEKYEIIEVRDHLKEKWKNNPFVSFLNNHKSKLQKIQEKEQEEQGLVSSKNAKANDARSCLECHETQTNFWQKTPHSISFYTLVQNQAQNNTQCVGCHTIKFKKPEGFYNTKNVVLFSKDDKNNHNNYWKDVEKLFKGVKSIKKEDPKKIQKISTEWFSLDNKKNVQHNFANVQCLNCHYKVNDHPFDQEVAKDTTSMQSKCIKCHTQDQSPEWYNKDEKGLASTINNKHFAKQIKKVACPKDSE